MGVVRSTFARRLAGSGVMALTGRADGPALVAPEDVVDRVDELGERAGIDGLAALAERAAFAGLTRQGDHSCGGSSRLLPSGDGWISVTLARDDDRDLVPAWLEADVASAHPWEAVGRAFATRPPGPLVERARMLGLPVAAVGDVSCVPTERATGLPVATTPWTTRRPSPNPSAPLVVDLSSLWAGPLCARVLGDAGADVVKVESVHRPDGARGGPAGFFDLLHGGHRAVALDFRTPDGVATLGRLLSAADVVIESSRPRALAHLGLAAEDVLAAGDGPSVWVSITGYGRSGPGRNRVAFGDDAAAAGGLVAWDEHGPVFFADAAADPLSGLVAAAAAQTALAAGGTWLVDVAMAEVAAWVAGGTDRRGWVTDPSLDATAPRQPPVQRRAAGLGEHTDQVLASLAPDPQRAP